MPWRLQLIDLWSLITTACSIKMEPHIFVRRKQTSVNKLVQLGSFTGFCWCCWLAILKCAACLIFFANDDVKNCVIIYCLQNGFFDLLKRETPDFIPLSLWPPNSPDLSPIDKKICGLLQQRVYSRKIQNADELRQRIVEEWERLNQRVIDNAVKQWHRCLRSCVAANGRHFELMLSCANL